MITVVITGAAGRIGYSLIPLLCEGTIFGDMKLSLRLFDIEMAESKLQGIKLEIEDCCYKNVVNVIATVDPESAFHGADVAILLGGFPRLPGMERKDLIVKNAEGMKQQAQYLTEYASRNCKVLVVANPANTNCLVAIKSAVGIPPENFSCLTRLDHERLKGIVASTINSKYSSGSQIESHEVKDVFIFGNHSTTQVVYTGVGTFPGGNISDILTDEDSDNLLPKVQNRGAEIIRYQQASSALSAANAIAKHLRDWLGPDEGQTFSMGILSNGNPYGIPDDLVFSFPCQRIAGGKSGDVYIVPDLPIDTRTRSLLKVTIDELEREKCDAAGILSGGVSLTLK